MYSTTRATRRFTAVATSIAIAIALGGCGGSDVSAAGSEATAEPAIATGLTDNAATGESVTQSGPAGGEVAAGGEVTQPNRSADRPAARADASTSDAPDQRAGQAPRPGAPDGVGAATTATTAVSRMVGSHPIFGGTQTCRPATLSEIAVGNVSTLSGVLGELFAPVRPTLETFVASQNACGGLNGHRIKLFIEDDQGDPATAITKVQYLIQERKVLAFVGNIQVLTVDAIVPTIRQTGVPVIGADLTNNTWFTNPLMFPQGAPPQAVAYGYAAGATEYHKKRAVGIVWCIEVPRSCEQINRAFLEMAPQLGADVKKSLQVSITAPSYVQQCLEMKNAAVEVVALNLDAASQVRFARSCEQVGYYPKVVTYPVAVGNEKQFFGNKWLGNAYVPQNTFAWMASNTPAERYYQGAVRKYNPGVETGGAASLGWTAGALLVAASAGLSEQNPTTQQFLDALYTFRGQEWTRLGGLSPSPLTFREKGNPKVPYCLYAAVTNDANNGWKSWTSKPTCTDVIAPSDPQRNA